MTSQLLQKKRNSKFPQFILCLFLIHSSAAFAQIKGFVYRDFNGSGTYDNNLKEKAIAGLTVKAYGVNDNLVASTVTDSDGNYKLQVNNGQYRLEFSIGSPDCTIDNSIDFPSYNGSNYGTSVRFVTAPANNVDFAINNPGDYAYTTNASIATSLFTNGDPNLTNAGTKPNAIKLKYNAVISVSPTSSANNTVLANNVNLGSVWGVAYSKQASKLFYSAVLKRHAGLGNGAGGTNTGKATGAIYIVDTTMNGNVRLFADLDALGFPTRGTGVYAYTGANTGKAGTNNIPLSTEVGTNVQRGIPDAFTAFGATNGNYSSYDAAALAQAGKVGLGGIDVSDDGKHVYVVNLYDRKLYVIETQNVKNPVLATATEVTSYAIPNPNFTGGTYRPWAVKYYRGKVFVGMVNDLSNTTLLSGTTSGVYSNAGGAIYKFNLKSKTFTLETTVALNYAKLSPDVNSLTTTTTAGGNNNFQHALRYNPWNDNYNNFRQDNNIENEKLVFPQPIISDIEFDINGSIYLGVMDRLGLQVSYRNYSPSDDGGDGNLLGTSSTSNGRSELTSGDVIMITKNANNCGYNNQWPSATNNEYYKGEEHKFNGLTNNNTKHPETALGGIALKTTANQLLTNAFDPSTEVNAGGIIALDNITGNTPFIGSVNCGANAYDASTRGVTSAKGLGMGDIETIADLAPLEIGNRVWRDNNANGIQDANENGIANVNLDLYADTNNDGLPDGNIIATTVTNQKGEWYFNNSNVTNGLTANTSYVVRLSVTGPGADWNTSLNGNMGAAVPGQALSGLVLTYTDRIGNGIPDLSDNDAIVQLKIPQIAIQLGNNGENVHNYDFGFIEPTLLPNVMVVNVTKNAQSTNVTISNDNDANIQYYEIERGVNTTQLSSIGRISNVLGRLRNVYNFIDNQPIAGVNYYRVKAMNRQNNILYSDIKVINFSKDDVFLVYPNPTKDKAILNIGASFINKPLHISVIDMLGKVCNTIQINSASNAEIIDVEKLSNGKYNLRITSSNQLVLNTQLIIQHN